MGDMNDLEGCALNIANPVLHLFTTAAAAATASSAAETPTPPPVNVRVLVAGNTILTVEVEVEGANAETKALLNIPGAISAHERNFASSSLVLVLRKLAVQQLADKGPIYVHKHILDVLQQLKNGAAGNQIALSNKLLALALDIEPSTLSTFKGNGKIKDVEQPHSVASKLMLLATSFDNLKDFLFFLKPEQLNALMKQVQKQQWKGYVWSPHKPSPLSKPPSLPAMHTPESAPCSGGLSAPWRGL